MKLLMALIQLLLTGEELSDLILVTNLVTGVLYSYKPLLNLLTWRKLWLRLSIYGFGQICIGINQPRLPKPLPVEGICHVS